MKISDQLIEDIRSHVNIVDVIGDYISLEKRGRNYFACCPFHQEDTPSFSVSEEKQLFYCFGCHEGGNVFSFPMKYEGLNFQESVLHVAEYTDIDVSQIQNTPHTQNVSLYQEYYDLMKFVSEFYEYLLQTDKGKVAKQYLTKRGISEEMIKQFHIGFVPNEHLLGELLEEKGYSLEKARDLGLVFESKDMLKYYDAFRGRIVFPVTDSLGNIVAFSGRILDIYESKDTPKYFHSPENIIFKKREIFYNYSVVKNEIKKEKEVYICEGIFDVIALARAGVKNAIGTLGTALTSEQTQLLKKMRAQVTFVFDNDNAGKNAMLRALEITAQQKIRAKAVIFWEYGEKDLDEFIQHFDGTRLKQLMEQKINANDYYIKYYQSTLNLDNNEDRQEFVKNIVHFLQYSDLVTKEDYYKEIKTITGYSSQALQELIKKAIPTHANDNAYASISGQNDNLDYRDKKYKNKYQPHLLKNKITRLEWCERLIVKGLCSGNEYIKLYQNNAVLSQDMLFRKLVYEILDEFRLCGVVDASRLMGKLSPAETNYLSQAIYLEEPMDITIFNELLDILKQETEKKYYRNAAIHNNANDKNKMIEDIQQFLEFKKKSN